MVYLPLRVTNKLFSYYGKFGTLFKKYGLYNEMLGVHRNDQYVKQTISVSNQVAMVSQFSFEIVYWLQC